MKKSIRDWMTLIQETNTAESASGSINAICPVCHQKESTPISGSELLDKASARAKILHHMLEAHSEQVMFR